MTTTASDIYNQGLKNGQAIKKLQGGTPYIPPASVTVPANSNVPVPPIPQGTGE